MPRSRKRKNVKDRPLIRSEERDEGKDRKTYKVRCAHTYAFYMFVEAHDRDEAEYMAELHCRKHDKEEDLFWESEASYAHSCFEAEEAE